VADSQTFKLHTGCLLSLRARPAPWLDRLAGGLSQLAPCRQLQHGQSLWLRLGPDEWWCWQDDAGTDAANASPTAAAARPARSIPQCRIPCPFALGRVDRCMAEPSPGAKHRSFRNSPGPVQQRHLPPSYS
jgi:hypothetical protein